MLINAPLHDSISFLRPMYHRTRLDRYPIPFDGLPFVHYSIHGHAGVIKCIPMAMMRSETSFWLEPGVYHLCLAYFPLPLSPDTIPLFSLICTTTTRHFRRFSLARPKDFASCPAFGAVFTLHELTKNIFQPLSFEFLLLFPDASWRVWIWWRLWVDIS